MRLPRRKGGSKVCMEALTAVLDRVGACGGAPLSHAVIPSTGTPGCLPREVPPTPGGGNLRRSLDQSGGGVSRDRNGDPRTTESERPGSGRIRSSRAPGPPNTHARWKFARTFKSSMALLASTPKKYFNSGPACVLPVCGELPTKCTPEKDNLTPAALKLESPERLMGAWRGTPWRIGGRPNTPIRGQGVGAPH